MVAKRVLFDASVIDEIIKTIGSCEPETGGVLGADLINNEFHVTDFHYIQPATSGWHTGFSNSHFSPDHNEINHVVDDVWTPQGKWLCGIIHSHPNGFNQLSNGQIGSNDGDLPYFHSLMFNKESEKFGLNHFIAPIVTFKGREMKMTVWVLERKFFYPVKAIVEVNCGNEIVSLNEYLEENITPMLIGKNEQLDYVEINNIDHAEKNVKLLLSDGLYSLFGNKKWKTKLKPRRDI